MKDNEKTTTGRLRGMMGAAVPRDPKTQRLVERRQRRAAGKARSIGHALLRDAAFLAGRPSLDEFRERWFDACTRRGVSTSDSAWSVLQLQFLRDVQKARLGMPGRSVAKFRA
jgi:hypothetical protein